MWSRIKPFLAYWWECVWIAGKTAYTVSSVVGTVLGIVGSLVFRHGRAVDVSYYVAWVAVSAFAAVMLTVLLTAPVKRHQRQQDQIERLRRPDDNERRRSARVRVGALLTKGESVQHGLKKDRAGALDEFHAFVLEADQSLRNELDSSYVDRLFSSSGVIVPRVPRLLSKGDKKEQRTAWSKVTVMVTRLQEFLKELA